MPFLKKDDEHGFFSNKTFGGTERFQQLAYEVLVQHHDVYVAEITKEQLHSRKTAKIMAFYIMEFQPDVIFSNDHLGSMSHQLAKFGKPMVQIVHSPIQRVMMNIELGKNIKQQISNGNKIYFVSQLQYEFFDRMQIRITGTGINGISGLINSAYANPQHQPSSVIQYDAGTIGRSEMSKNPFWIHKKLQNTGLTSLVLTGKNYAYRNPKQIDYLEKNSGWEAPQWTIRGLPHADTMNEVAKCGVYISTWPHESWGITALEALSHGCPTILVTDSTGKHASECIPANPDHIRKVQSNIKPGDLVSIIREHGNITPQQRKQISDDTKLKNSKEKWSKDILSMFDNI